MLWLFGCFDGFQVGLSGRRRLERVTSANDQAQLLGGRVNYDHRKDRRLITGTGGSGKTTHFLRLIAEHRARWKFIFDPEREVARKLRWPISIDVPGMNARAARCEPVCFDPAPLFCDHEEGFDFFCRYVYELSCALDGVKLFASDEVQDFTETGRGGIPSSFKTLLQKGRRQEIDVLLIAQSLGEAHDKIRSQLSHIITFRHQDALALDWLKRNGFDPQAVAALRYPGGWICRNRDNGDMITNEKAKAKPARTPGNPPNVARGKAIDDRRGAQNLPARR